MTRHLAPRGLVLGLAILLAVLFAALFAATARASECNPEFVFAAFDSDVRATNPAVRGRDLDAAERIVFVANFNAVPPETTHAPERVVVYMSPFILKALVAFVDGGGCVFVAESIPLPSLMQLLGGAAKSGHRI